MITDDRLKLNERFIKVFDILEARGVIVLNDRDGRGMGDFAERILGNRTYGHIIRAFLNREDRRVIDYHHAQTLCKEFGVNENWMLHGKGTPFGIEPGYQSAQVPRKTSNNILFTTTQAFAGSTIGADSFDKEDLDFFHIPGLAGKEFVSFPIKGNSMEPVINDEDIVICKAVDSIEKIRDNDIYAVKSNGAIWVKYVQKIPDHKGRVRHLRLISANHLEHDPFEEEVNEYTRVYKVVRRICDVN
ncbi:MAG: S24 family peptidase [Saprospiraceae bacterium]|nr:S24 family peptidase [Saprospiraceae bacterium]